MSIGFSEKLSEAVKRFACLCDKTNKLFKDQNVNRNALEIGMLLKLS